MPVDSLMTQLTVLSLAAVPIVKGLVGLLRMACTPPSWATVMLVLIGGIGTVVLMMIAFEMPLTLPAISMAVLAGFMTAFSAVGITEMDRRRQPHDDEEEHRA